MSETTGPDSILRTGFPTTRWTLLRTAQDPSSPGYREALNELASLYWRPIAAYFQTRWRKRPEEAADLTQDFFQALCEREFLKGLDPARGRFRSYVRTALDNFAKQDHRFSNAQKRGGAAAYIPMDLASTFQPSQNLTPDEIFLREWARSVLMLAVDELELECTGSGKAEEFEIFRARDLEGSVPGKAATYGDLARKFGLSETDVTNMLHRVRGRLRELVLLRVRDTVDSESEAEAELRDLFGSGPGG